MRTSEIFSVNRGLAPILIIFVALGLTVAIGSVAYMQFYPGLPSQNQPTPTQSPQSIPTSTDFGSVQTEDPQSANWKTYIDQKFNYSFMYPANLTLETQMVTGEPYFFKSQRVGDTIVFIKANEEKSSPTLYSASPLHLESSQTNMSLIQFVETQGSFINLCHEEKPAKTEEVITKSGVVGIKARYWVQEGCQGAASRYINDPDVLFDARPKNSLLIKFYGKDNDETFDQILSTFKFVE